MTASSRPRLRSRSPSSSAGVDGCRRGGPERGQATVELVLTLPVLVIGLLAVVQVARVASDYVTLHHAVREAARHAAISPDAAVVARATVATSPDLDDRRLSVELGPGRQRGELLPVTVRYRAATDVPVVGRLVGDVELSATAVVLIE